MTSEGESHLGRVQYGPEQSARERIEADSELHDQVIWARNAFGVNSMRQQLLSNAVRVSNRMLPDMARSLEQISKRARLDKPLESYVFASSELNAAVIPSRDYMIVVVSSATIERLTSSELDFVIGHELGHATFGHLDFPASALVAQSNSLSPRDAMRLMAWQRKAEISADRAGLLCCGYFETAAKAMFKTLSGLTMEAVTVDPTEIANQWNDLAAELSREAHRDRWMATHPFPPLRMRALLRFSESDAADSLLATEGKRPIKEVDEEIERMLSMIDPLAREEAHTDGGGDPILRDFFLWGGMYVAAADGSVDDCELENLATLVGREPVQRLRDEGMLAPETYRKRFMEARERRQKPLTALEIQRIFTGLAAIAKADGIVEETEREAMRQLGQAVGISDGFVRTLFS